MRIHLTLLAIFSCLFLLSCKKDTVTIIKEVPLVRSWSLDSSLFFDNKILLTSVVLDDSTVGVANNEMIWYINANALNTSINGAYVNYAPNYGYMVKPSITKTIGVSLIDSNRLRVFSTLSPVQNFSSFTYAATYTSSKSSVKGFPLAYFPNSNYPIINSKYILAPTEIDYEAKKAYMSLLMVDYSDNPITNSVSLISSKTVTLTPGPGTIGFADANYFSAAYYGKFFLSYNEQFYRIDTLGNVKAFGYCPVPSVDNGRVTQMFTIDQYLFGIGLAKIFVSQDQGETWSLFSDITGTNYGGLNYFNVGNELYATWGSQIWRVTLTGSTLNYQELDNDGLATNLITSVNKVGKYAFLTTLSGLYYRDTASFNTPKQ